MFIFLAIVTIIIATLFVLKNIQLLFLLQKLGFSWAIGQFMLVEAIIVGALLLLTIGVEYTSPLLIVISIVLGMLLPVLFSVTKKKHNPKKRKTKPKYMSQSEWLWSEYTTSLPNKKGSKSSKGSDSSGGFWGGGDSDSDCGSDGGGDGGGCD